MRSGCSHPSRLLSPELGSAPASSPSAWCRAASVNQQHPLNRFFAGSMLTLERGTLQPCHGQTPLHHLAPRAAISLAPQERFPAPRVAQISPVLVGDLQPPGQVKAEQQAREQLLQQQSTRHHWLCLRTCHSAGGPPQPPILGHSGSSTCALVPAVDAALRSGTAGGRCSGRCCCQLPWLPRPFRAHLSLPRGVFVCQ